MLLFFYEVKLFNSYDNELFTERGAVTAESFEEATKQIEGFYGDELDSLAIRIGSEGCPLLFPDEETYKKVMEVNM